MVLLVDNSNIINISYAVFAKTMHDKNGPEYLIKEEDLGMFWHLYIHKIKDYLANYKNIIFCGEGHNSTAWRKNKYPLYKENRKERAENPDYAYIGKCYKDVEEFLSYFHCSVLRTDNCEADDEIYALTKYFTEKGEQVNIISSDKDLTQLCGMFDGVTIFNPMSSVNKKCVAVTTVDNYNKNIIMEKAIVGDASDNIKGLPRCGGKTFEKMLADPAEWSKQMSKGDNAKLYNTILDIVDLSKYPAEYQKAIIDNFEAKGYNEFRPDMVDKFYFEHQLNQCAREWSSLEGDILINLRSTDETKAQSCEDEIMEILNS